MSTLLLVLGKLLLYLSYLVFFDMLLSWIQSPDAAPRKWIQPLLEPAYAPLRAIIPNLGGLDFTPLVLAFVLQAIAQLLLNAATVA